MAELQDSLSQDVNTEEKSTDADIQAPIIGYEVVEARKRFTVYQISVKLSDGRSWFVFRRYSDFSQLDENLRKLYAEDLQNIELPPKKYLGDNFSDIFIEMRKRGLQKYLNRILERQELSWTQPVIEFLCLDDPPGPYDSLQESRAFIESLEETVSGMRQKYQELDSELKIAKSQLRSTLSHKRALLVALRAERVLNGKPAHDNDDVALMSEYTGHPDVGNVDLKTFVKEDENLKRRKSGRNHMYKSQAASQLDLTFAPSNSRKGSSSSENENNSRRARSVSDLPNASRRRSSNKHHLPTNRRGLSVIDKFMRQSTDALEQIRLSVRQKLGRWEDEGKENTQNQTLP